VNLDGQVAFTRAAGTDGKWQKHRLGFKREELLTYGGVGGSGSTRYITTHDGDIEFCQLIRGWVLDPEGSRAFAEWVFIGLFRGRGPSRQASYIGQQNRVGIGARSKATLGHFGRTGRSVQRPRLGQPGEDLGGAGRLPGRVAGRTIFHRRTRT